MPDTTARRHDIDALRAIAFALVLLYHLGMYYAAGWEWHLKSGHAPQWLGAPMQALNLWRMGLVFLVSGVALAILQRSSSAGGGLLVQRSKRLLVPLAVASAVVVPYQPYAEAVAKGLAAPGFGEFVLRYFRLADDLPPWPIAPTWAHLWYLAFLWVHTALLLALMPLLRCAAGRRVQAAFLGLRGPALLLVPVVPIAVASLLLWGDGPRPPVVGPVFTQVLYFLLFLYGWWIGLDAGFWREAARLRWPALCWALLLLLALAAVRDLAGPAQPLLARKLGRLVADAYVWAVIATALGWAHHALNRPWRWLGWANESVVPWYVLHQTALIVLVVWLAPLRLGPVAEPLVLAAGTVLLCWMCTCVIRRSDWLRPAFGLKRRSAPDRAAVPAAAGRGAVAAPVQPGVALRQRLDLGDAVQVHGPAAVHAREAGGVELAGEVGQGRPQQVVVALHP